MVRNRGLTLLEMLVALVILTSIMTLASTAYRFYVTGFNQRGQLFDKSLSAMKKQAAWQQQLSAAFYYMVPIAPNNYRPLFVGRTNEVFWMSSTSIMQPGAPVAAWLGMLQGELTYCEAGLNKALIKSFEQLAQSEKICSHFSQKIQPVSELSISYFSWEDIFIRDRVYSEAAPIPPALKPQWSSSHNSIDKLLLPEWIKITLTQEDGQFDIWIRLESDDQNRFSFFGAEGYG